MIFGSGYELESSRGVQQGDFCGPALFAVGLHWIALKVEEVGLQFQFLHLDDLVLCGSVASIERAMDILRTEFPKIGLAINPAKCKLFGPAAVDASSPLFDGSPWLKVPFFLVFRWEVTNLLRTSLLILLQSCKDVCEKIL